MTTFGAMEMIRSNTLIDSSNNNNKKLSTLRSLKFNVGIPATVVCLSLSSFFSSPAYSKKWYEKVGDYLTQAGDKFAAVVDVTDKNSDARRILRNLDITNPNSPACNTLRTGGDDVSAAATSSGNPKAMAAGAAIQVAKKICGNVAQGKAVNSDDAEIDMAVMYQTQLAIEQAKLNNDFAKAKLLEESKVQLEELQQQGQTERVKIVQENLLAITLSNNQTAIALGEQNLRAVESNNWALVRQAEINSYAQIVIAQNTNATNIAIANSNNNASTTNTIVGAIGQVLTTAIATSNNQQPPSVATTTSIQGNTTDPIRSMGLTPTNCNPSSAIIAIGSQAYCVQPDRGLQSGMRYAYNSQTNSLSPLSTPSVVNLPTVTTPPVGVTDSRIALIQSWGFTLSRCSSTTAKISIDGQKALCVVPANGLKPGQKYSYNSETRSFKRIPSTTTGTNTVRTPQEVPPVRTNNGGNGF